MQVFLAVYLDTQFSSRFILPMQRPSYICLDFATTNPIQSTTGCQLSAIGPTSCCLHLVLRGPGSSVHPNPKPKVKTNQWRPYGIRREEDGRLHRPMQRKASTSVDWLKRKNSVDQQIVFAADVKQLPLRQLDCDWSVNNVIEHMQEARPCNRHLSDRCTSE